MDESVKATEGSIYNNLLIRLDIDELIVTPNRQVAPPTRLYTSKYICTLSVRLMIDSCHLYPYIIIPVDIWTSAGFFFLSLSVMILFASPFFLYLKKRAQSTNLRIIYTELGIRCIPVKEISVCLNERV